MSAGPIVYLVSTWMGSIVFLIFILFSIHASGLAVNWLLGIKTRGIAAIAYSAATGSLLHALLGIGVSVAGANRHIVAMVLLAAVLAASVAILLRGRLIRAVYEKLDRGDLICLAIYFAFLCLCSWITYLPIRFPALPDGPYVYKSHNAHVKIQVIAGDLPCDNLLPEVVAEYLLRGISFATEHPIMPGEEVTNRPILMALVVVPFRAAFDQPPLQSGPMRRFQYVGTSWPDGSVFGDDGTFRQFLIVAIALNGMLLLAAATILKRLGDSSVQIAGCLLILLNPYFLSETFFTWPKCLAAFFVLLALDSLEYLESRKHLVAGVLAGLAYLSHPFALVYAGSFGLYLLWQFRSKKCTLTNLLHYAGAFAATVAPWFLWCLYLQLPSDLVQQNLRSQQSLAAAVWVRLHVAYETLGARMFEIYPFNSSRFLQVSNFCLPGIVGLLFVAHGYREVLETLRTKPLVSVFGILLPVTLLFAPFGYDAVPALHGMQAAGVLILVLALVRFARQIRTRTLYTLVALQMLLNGVLLYVQAGNLGMLEAWK